MVDNEVKEKVDEEIVKTLIVEVVEEIVFRATSSYFLAKKESSCNENLF